MRAVRSFEDLIAWQRAIDLAAEVYQLTRQFPKEELFGLTSQLRRAAVSISSNIAEGQSRNSSREFIHFLGIARGSNAELRSQLKLARRLSFGDAGSLDRCEISATEISKMLPALITTLRRKD